MHLCERSDAVRLVDKRESRNDDCGGIELSTVIFECDAIVGASKDTHDIPHSATPSYNHGLALRAEQRNEEGHEGTWLLVGIYHAATRIDLFLCANTGTDNHVGAPGWVPWKKNVGPVHDILVGSRVRDQQNFTDCGYEAERRATLVVAEFEPGHLLNVDIPFCLQNLPGHAYHRHGDIQHHSVELARGDEFETLQQRFESFCGRCRLVPCCVPQSKIEVSNQQAYIDRVEETNQLGERCTESSHRFGPGIMREQKIMHPRVVAKDAGQGDFATSNVEFAHFVPGVGPTVLLAQCDSRLGKQKRKSDLRSNKKNNVQN